MSPTEQHQSTTQTPPHAASRSSDTNSAAQPRLSSRTSITDCKLGWFKRCYRWSFESSLVCVCVCVCVCVARWPGSWESPPSSRPWSGLVSTAASVARLSSRWRRRRRSSWGGTSPPPAGCEVSRAGDRERERELDLLRTHRKPNPLVRISPLHSRLIRADLFENHVSLKESES